MWLAIYPGDGSAVLVPILVLRFNLEELEEPRDNALVSVYISELAALYFYLPPSGIRGLFVVTRGVTREITRVVTRVMWDSPSASSRSNPILKALDLAASCSGVGGWSDKVFLRFLRIR